jgi:hypothetical protein
MDLLMERDFTAYGATYGTADSIRFFDFLKFLQRPTDKDLSNRELD